MKIFVSAAALASMFVVAACTGSGAGDDAAKAKDETATAAPAAEGAAKEGESKVITTASGLQYEVLTEGTGPSPSATDQVSVHYAGTLLDGTEFDSSYKRGQPATFPLNRVIPGWTEGVQLMNVGAKYKFTIPGDLAYGAAGIPGTIPPNSTLIFEVELLEIL
jgi:FKBP-type peptidyl-prolyl cis-trans isomerase FkpA